MKNSFSFFTVTIMLLSLMTLTSCYTYETGLYSYERPRVIVIDNRTRTLHHYHSPRPTDYHSKYKHHGKPTSSSRYTNRGKNQRTRTSSGGGNKR